MGSKTKGKRLFCGMSYAEVQRSNSTRRKHLPRKDQRWLKENGYRNVGWDNVIQFYQTINDLLSRPDDPSLEELFLKAEQIGNKYQTPEEIQAFEQAFRSEVDAIAQEVDRQFPDEEYEVVDYSQPSATIAKKRITDKRKR